MDAAQISKVYAQLDPPLWLVTAADGGRRGGLIATTVTQASIVGEMPRTAHHDRQTAQHARVDRRQRCVRHALDRRNTARSGLAVWIAVRPRRRQACRSAVPYRSDRKPAAARGAGLVRLPSGSTHGLGRPHRLPRCRRRWSAGANRSATDKRAAFLISPRRTNRRS